VTDAITISGRPTSAPSRSTASRPGAPRNDSQVSDMSRPSGRYTIGVDSVGTPRSTSSAAPHTTNHHGASHQWRTASDDSPMPATRRKIASAPAPSAIGGTL